jgi:hypothetical protein
MVLLEHCLQEAGSIGRCCYCHYGYDSSKVQTKTVLQFSSVIQPCYYSCFIIFNDVGPET